MNKHRRSRSMTRRARDYAAIATFVTMGAVGDGLAADLPGVADAAERGQANRSAGELAGGPTTRRPGDGDASADDLIERQGG